MHQNKLEFEALDKRFNKYKIKVKGSSKFLTEDNKHFRMCFESKNELGLDNTLWVLETDVEFISDNFDVYNYEASEILTQWFSNKYNVKVSTVGQLIPEYVKPLSINLIENVTE